MGQQHPLFVFIVDVLLRTGSQLISLLGVFLFFGFLLFFLAKFTRNTYVKSVGINFDIYFTGWIGTPVHEVGHSIFCLLFGHKITEIKLFSPEAKNGSLGYVNHSYNPKNLWHRIGNFFIGMGPIIFGSIVIYFLFRLAVPDHSAILFFLEEQGVNISSWEGIKKVVFSFFPNLWFIVRALFSDINLGSWSFYLFLYIALSISSHMELSPPDLKGLGSGLLTIIILILVINILIGFFGFEVDRFIVRIDKVSQLASGILLLATTFSFSFFILSYFLLNIYTLIRYKTLINPFW